MKAAAYVLIALIVGLILGSWSLKADLRNARTEIASLKMKLASRDSGQSGLGGITSMLKIQEKTRPDPVRRGSRPAPRARPAGAPADTNAAGAAVALTNTAPTVASNSVARHRHAHGATNLLQSLETASALWKTRADLARNSFVSTVTTTEEQAAQFEVTMAAMNIRLSNNIRTWVDFVKKEGTVTPETGIRIMNDLSSSLVLAYNDLDRTMPPDWRQKAGAKFQVFDFINPEVAMPLTEVETIFSAMDHGDGPPAAVQPSGVDDDEEFSVTFP